MPVIEVEVCGGGNNTFFACEKMVVGDVNNILSFKSKKEII